MSTSADLKREFAHLVESGQLTYDEGVEHLQRRLKDLEAEERAVALIEEGNTSG